MAQGRIADGRIIFEGKEKDTKPLLAKLSLGHHCILSMCIPSVFPAPCIVMLKVYVVREIMPNHKLFLAYDKISIEIESKYLEMFRGLFDVAVASSILQKFWSAMDWKLKKTNKQHTGLSL